MLPTWVLADACMPLLLEEGFLVGVGGWGMSPNIHAIWRLGGLLIQQCRGRCHSSASVWSSSILHHTFQLQHWHVRYLSVPYSKGGLGMGTLSFWWNTAIIVTLTHNQALHVCPTGFGGEGRGDHTKKGLIRECVEPWKLCAQPASPLNSVFDLFVWFLEHPGCSAD